MDIEISSSKAPLKSITQLFTERYLRPLHSNTYIQMKKKIHVYINSSWYVQRSRGSHGNNKLLHYPATCCKLHSRDSFYICTYIPSCHLVVVVAYKNIFKLNRKNLYLYNSYGLWNFFYFVQILYIYCKYIHIYFLSYYLENQNLYWYFELW